MAETLASFATSRIVGIRFPFPEPVFFREICYRYHNNGLFGFVNTQNSIFRKMRGHGSVDSNFNKNSRIKGIIDVAIAFSLNRVPGQRLVKILLQRRKRKSADSASRARRGWRPENRQKRRLSPRPALPDRKQRPPRQAQARSRDPA